MKRTLLLAVALLVATAFAVADDGQSGLAVGDSVGAFTVEDVTGPAKGESLCYRCRYGQRPTVAIFTREVDENLAGLVKEIDGQVAENEDKKLAAFVVLLTDDTETGKTKLAELATKHGITNTPLTVYKDSKGPAGYKVAEKCGVNVMFWVNSKVKSNQALAGTPDKEQATKIAGETAKILE